MPKKSAAEFYWSEKRQAYRKRIPNPQTGGWADVWGRTKQETREKARLREASFSREAEIAEDPFFYQYAARWYGLNSVNVKDKARTNYKTAINKHICPVIGHKRLRSITSDDAAAVMAACSGYANETQKRTLSVLRRIFKAAVSAGYLSRNPADGLKASGRKTAERVPLTRSQQETLISCLEGHRCQLFCALILYSGLRPEEALGLKWDCVHLDGSVPFIEVRRALQWSGNRVQLSDELKSAAARRDIPIPPQLVFRLNTQKKKALGDFVIEDAKGSAMSRNAYRRMWAAVVQRSEREVRYKVNGREYSRRLKVGDVAPYTKIRVAIDFPVVPYQLRHTYITELILSGANVKSVQYLAGHSDPMVTLRIYSHLMDNRPSETQSVVLKAFE